MDTQDPNLILAAGASHYESPQIAASRALQIQQQQQGLQAGAQDMQLGAQKLQAAKYGNQATAVDLAEQQTMLDAMQRQAGGGAPGAAAPAAPATASGTAPTAAYS